MMSMELRVTLLFFVIGFIVMVLKKLKDKTILTKYALLWIISALAMLIAVIFPSLFTLISSFLGFEKTSNMVFLIGFFILLCIVFGLTMIISKQKKEVITLIQQVSILTYRFEHEEKN